MPVKLPQLILSIGICLGAGVLGSFFTVASPPAGGLTWYATLNKLSFSPPNWVFGPVWALLYIMMGISLYLVVIAKARNREKAIFVFVLQLVLNALWSIIFFGMKNPTLALVDIAALWIAIFLTIKAFFKISKPSAYLLIPYFLWVSFASILNLSIVLPNP